jgi:hypothetical protein
MCDDNVAWEQSQYAPITDHLNMWMCAIQNATQSPPENQELNEQDLAEYRQGLEALGFGNVQVHDDGSFDADYNGKRFLGLRVTAEHDTDPLCLGLTFRYDDYTQL